MCIKNKNTVLIVISISILILIFLITSTVFTTSQLYQNRFIINSHARVAIEGELDPQDAGIFLYNTTFSNLWRITPRNILTYSPSWSPDGKRIAFVYSDLDKREFHVAVIPKGGGGIESLIDKGVGEFLIHQDTALAWSPDGSRLLFDVASNDGCRYLFLYEFVDKSTHQVIGKLCQSITGHSVYKIDISWFPSDTPLIGVSYHGFYNYMDDIYLLDQTLTRLDWLVHGAYPVWRPTTKDFSYLCWKTETSFSPSICLFSSKDNSTTELVEKYGFDQYSWSPDGHSILYVETSGESDPVFLSIIKVETGKKYRLLELAKHQWIYVFPVSSRWVDGKAIWSFK